jgi:hypothetical protein
VRIVEVPGETLAVLRFAGGWSPDDIAARREALMRTVGSSRWQAAGEPVTFFYDPPWTIPYLRRNEVAVAVELRTGAG